MGFHRRLPHLRPFSVHPLVFLTVVTHQRRFVLSNQQACGVLRELWEKSMNQYGWFVGKYLIMPDHIHLFAVPAIVADPMASWIGSWKSLAARRLKEVVGIQPPLWQRDYFDRFLRSASSYAREWDYVAMNPVRKGLCARTEDWPWQGSIHDLRF